MDKIVTGRKTDEVFKDAFMIREEVFVKEQGFKDEADNYDSKAYHTVMYDGDKPISTARFFIKDGDDECIYTIGRVCTMKEARGKGLATKVMQAVEKEIKELGGKKIKLSAQHQAMPFYEKIGYLKVSEGYYDEHCLHFDMEKEIEGE